MQHFLDTDISNVANVNGNFVYENTAAKQASVYKW